MEYQQFIRFRQQCGRAAKPPDRSSWAAPEGAEDQARLSGQMDSVYRYPLPAARQWNPGRKFAIVDPAFPAGSPNVIRFQISWVPLCQWAARSVRSGWFAEMWLVCKHNWIYNVEERFKLQYILQLPVTAL